MHTKQSQYNPRGLDTKKPIQLRLMPKERADIIQLAETLNVSQSSLARRAYLAGIETVKSSLQTKAD